MARPGRPVSEHFKPGGNRVTSPTEAGTKRIEEDDDRAPIFSLSKSSVDMLMAVGAPHKRDPAWTRVDLKRSSSTNTHSEKNSPTLQQLHAHVLQRINTGNAHSSLPLGEQCTPNAERWSVCSGSAHSGSSTPDTAVWTGETMCPWSSTQETLCPAAPDSPISKIASLSTMLSPLVSPQQTPSLAPAEPFSPSLPLSVHQQEDKLTPSSTASPLPPPPFPDYSPGTVQLTGTEDESFLENHAQSFHFPSPPTSPINLEEEAGYESVSAERGCLVEGSVESLPSVTFSHGGTQSPGVGMGSPADVPMFMSQASNPPVEGQESKQEPSVCHLELPWQPGHSSPKGFFPCQGWRPALVSSLSDSWLDKYCRCDSNQSGQGITNLMASPRALKGEVLREEGAITLEEGTMTSQLELVDAAVQTISPAGSWWNIRRNMSYMSSNMGSHSILGSPPGSRLNLRSSLGSNSNLVSPSSSMFPMDSGEEEEGPGDGSVCIVSSPLSHPMERRRSCLKVQGEDKCRGGERGELGRRSSMKQVQWDEDGLTWDVYGASLDPDELSTAIQRHLELQSSKDKECPKQPKHKSKKRTAAKVAKTPVVENIVKPSPPVMVDTATSMVESQSEVMPDAEAEAEAENELEKEGGKKEETAEVLDETRKAEEYEKEKEKDGEGEEEEVYGEEGARHQKPSSHGSRHSQKKSVIRSLRPGWCGGSRKAND